jgi:ParB family chromosome partitioning protein
MGRGLSAILMSTADAPQEPMAELRQIAIDLIRPNPHQPRRRFDEGGLLSLAKSLTERGVLQPVLVRPEPGGTFELIAGERRLRAARLAGFEMVPAIVRPDDDAASLELALIENMAREDLNPVEEARACGMLVEELGLTKEDVARRVGRSRAAVSNLLRLLELPDEVIQLLIEGRLSEGHGRAVLMAPDHDDRRRIARAAAAEGWTVRHTEERARATTLVRRAGIPPRSLHPDQEAVIERLSGEFGRLLGADVRVATRGERYRMSLTFASLDEALAVIERLGAVKPAE